MQKCREFSSQILKTTIEKIGTTETTPHALGMSHHKWTQKSTPIIHLIKIVLERVRDSTLILDPPP